MRDLPRSDVKAGDRIRVTRENFGSSVFAKGSVFTVKQVDPPIYLVENDNGRGGLLFRHEFALLPAEPFVPFDTEARD
jgi:hypothetical protein